LFLKDRDGDEIRICGVEIASGAVRDLTPFSECGPEPAHQCRSSMKSWSGSTSATSASSTYRIDLETGACELDTQNWRCDRLDAGQRPVLRAAGAFDPTDGS
jgi:hypothetical protein